MVGAVRARVQQPPRPTPDREAVSRALISLVADLVWAGRAHEGAAPREPRDEAMALLSEVERGDRAAARRALQLLSAADGRAG